MAAPFARMIDEHCRMAGEPLPKAVAEVRRLILEIQAAFESDPHLSRQRFLSDVEHPLLRIMEAVAIEFRDR